MAQKPPKVFRAVRWKNSRVHIIDAKYQTLCEPENDVCDRVMEVNLELPMVREYADQLCTTCKGRSMSMGLELWRSEAENHAVKIDMRTFYDDGMATARWKCQEASAASGAFYVPCGEDADKLVLSERGKRIYPMCDACADHNIRNRGAVLLAVHQEMDV